MPTPAPVTVVTAATLLNDLGLFGVIAIGATLTLAGFVYRKFRK